MIPCNIKMHFFGALFYFKTKGDGGLAFVDPDL